LGAERVFYGGEDYGGLLVRRGGEVSALLLQGDDVVEDGGNILTCWTLCSLGEERIFSRRSSRDMIAAWRFSAVANFCFENYKISAESDAIRWRG